MCVCVCVYVCMCVCVCVCVCVESIPQTSHTSLCVCAKEFAKIPPTTDVLLTHGPPKGVGRLDR